MPGTSEDRSCTNKVRHPSLKYASRALRIMIRKGSAERGELAPYLCRFCHGWHLGHPPVELKVRRLRRTA
jgi:hypothetical protein